MKDLWLDQRTNLQPENQLHLTDLAGPAHVSIKNVKVKQLLYLIMGCKEFHLELFFLLYTIFILINAPGALQFTQPFLVEFCQPFPIKSEMGIFWEGAFIRINIIVLHWNVKKINLSKRCLVANIFWSSKKGIKSNNQFVEYVTQYT